MAAYRTDEYGNRFVFIDGARYWLSPCGHWSMPGYLLCEHCRHRGEPSTVERVAAMTDAEKDAALETWHREREAAGLPPFP